MGENGEEEMATRELKSVALTNIREMHNTSIYEMRNDINEVIQM